MFLFPVLIFCQIGNIGIGREKPEEKLHVAGNLRVDSLAGDFKQSVYVDEKGTFFPYLPLNEVLLNSSNGEIILHFNPDQGFFRISRGDTVLLGLNLIPQQSVKQPSVSNLQLLENEPPGLTGRLSSMDFMDNEHIYGDNGSDHWGPNEEFLLAERNLPDGSIKRWHYENNELAFITIVYKNGTTKKYDPTGKLVHTARSYKNNEGEWEYDVTYGPGGDDPQKPTTTVHPKYVYQSDGEGNAAIRTPKSTSFTSPTGGGVIKQTEEGIGISPGLSVQGTITKGSGSFKIDHPLDPYNKYLYHSFVESPDMMNVYNGNIITDNEGTIIVELPTYFTALNTDYRYQLTVLGSFAQATIAKEIDNNQFTIKTDKPNTKVSWQVTGIRNDVFARNNRIQVEVPKKNKMKGQLLHDLSEN